MTTVVGCVVRTSDGRTSLANASSPQVSTILHADEGEIEASRSVGPGADAYELVGTADFRVAGELVEEAERRLFTDRETANATGVLRPGHRVAVKALLVREGGRRILNLLSVQPVSDSCP